MRLFAAVLASKGVGGSPGTDHYTAADDTASAATGSGSIDVDVLANDTASGPKRIVSAAAVSPLPAAAVSITGTAPNQKVRIDKTGLAAGTYTVDCFCALQSNPAIGGASAITLTLSAVTLPTVDIARVGAENRTEGNSGSINVDFNVSRTGPPLPAGSVRWDLDGDVTPADLIVGQPLGGTLNWADGNGDTKLVRVGVKGDADVEPDERCAVRLSNPVNNLLGLNYAFAVIVNDDDGGGVGDYPEAPFTPTSIVDATTPSDFATKYAALSSGQWLRMPAGNFALPDGFAFNRAFPSGPGVAIVGAGMAANGRDPLTVIPSKDLTVTQNKHCFHQIQFTHSLSGSNSKLTDADPYIMRITAAYFSMTKCWMRGNRGIFFADSTACHDNYVGWNRMSTAVAQGLQFVKWSLEPLPTGSVKHRNSILANNYIRATGPSDDNNAYTIYIGNGHARGGDDRYIQGFKVVNNLWDSPAAGWDKALYFKCGVEEISGNTILNGTQSFIMRHGSITEGADATTSTISCQKLWNNYFDVSFFILGGAGHDVRGNYIKVNDGLRIDCGWTQGSGGQYHDAASHSLFVRNQIITGTDATRPYRLGYYDAGGTAPTDRRGGKLRDVKIWGHLGNALVPGISSLIHDAATVDAASLSFSTSLGSYADPGIATALAQTQVGFKVTGQNNG